MQVTAGSAPRGHLTTRAAQGRANVQFRLPKKVNFGQALSIATSTSGWKPDPNLRMVWSEGDEWKASADVSPGYVVLGPHGIVEWQSGGNRSLVVDVPEGGAVTVVDEWYGTFQKVSKDIPKTAEGAPSLPTVAAEPAQKRGHPLGFFAKHRLPASIHRTFSANKGAQNGTATEASKELTKKEAKALLEKRGLPTDGRKIDLLERLRASA